MQRWQSEPTAGPKGVFGLVVVAVVDVFASSMSKSCPNALCFGNFDPKRASHRNGMHFFDISASKSRANMCFLAFWLPNVLRATMACTSSTSELPKVVRTCDALYILTWKCASRCNSVQFLISHLACWLRTRRFSEPDFRASGATTLWKSTVFHDFGTFSRTCIFFLLTLSFL